MHIFKTIILALIFLLIGCKTNQTRNKLKEGRWIYADTVNAIPYKSTGKYKRGIEKITWRYYENNRLVKTEKYKKGICHVTTYFEDGKIASQGKTKLVTSETDTHWYYFDDWNFYDKTGKLIRVKKYENGELLKDTKLN
jgi:antitoxin component YwqK of YwqJK toxin-antitoxin module